MTRQIDDDVRKRGPQLVTAVSSVLPEQVVEALAELREQVLQIAAIDAKRDRVAAWTALVSGPLRPMLIEAWRTHQGDLGEILAYAQTLPGLAGPVSALKTSLKSHAKAAAAGLQVYEGSDDIGRSQVFTIDGEQIRVEVPDGWACDGGGVHKLQRRTGPDGTVHVEKARIAYGPILLTRCFREPGGGLAEYVELAWSKPGHPWKRMRVGRAQIAASRELCALAGQGVPVTSETAGRAVAWLAALEAENRLAPGFVSTRMGWQGSKHTHFLWGRRLIAPQGSDIEIELLDDDDAGLHATAAGLRSRGTWEGWLQAVAGVADRPLAWAAIYASCAAPLLAMLDCPAFIVDFHAPSGKGKSTAARLGMSVWGDASDAGGLKRSWSGTETGVETYAESMQSLPLLVDDSNTVQERDRAALASRIYMLANGVGKLRGSLKGTRRTRSWRTVTLSTGEQSLKSFTQDAGVHGRVVSLYGPPMGSALQAETMTLAIACHFGHLGPRLIEALVRLTPAERADLQDRYRDTVADLSAEMSSDTGRRVAQYLAAMVVAAGFVHERCGVPRPSCRPMDLITELADQGAAEGKRHEEAARQVLGAALARAGQIAHGVGENTPRTPPTGSGWIGRYSDAGPGWTWLALHKDFVREELRRRGFDWGAITTQWREAGFLQVRAADPKRQPGMPTTMPGDAPGARPEMLRFTRKMMLELGVVGTAVDDD